MNERKQWLARGLIGGLGGVAVLLVISGRLAGSTSPLGYTHFLGPMLVTEPMVLRLGGSEPLAITVQVLLFFLLGAWTGLATLPFADNGRSLVLRSLAHFAGMAVLVAVTTILNDGTTRWVWVYLLLLALVYLTVWLGRWAAWYGEVLRLRKALGLAEKPSFWGWRENLPLLLLLGGIFLLARPVLTPFDAIDVPVLTGILLPLIVYPLTAAVCGFIGGRHNGFSPLFPAAAFLSFLPNLLFPNAPYSLTMAAVYAAIALGFDLLGGAVRRKRSV